MTPKAESAAVRMPRKSRSRDGHLRSLELRPVAKAGAGPIRGAGVSDRAALRPSWAARERGGRIDRAQNAEPISGVSKYDSKNHPSIMEETNGETFDPVRRRNRRRLSLMPGTGHGAPPPHQSRRAERRLTFSRSALPAARSTRKSSNNGGVFSANRPLDRRNTLSEASPPD